MTISVGAGERTRSTGTKLSTTNATAVYTASGIAGAKGVSMSLCNVDGAAPVNATVEWYDSSATTAYKLLSTKAVAQNTRELVDLGAVWLDPSDELRVTASAANDLEVVTTVVETVNR